MVSVKKAEKEAKTFIDAHQKNTGWRSWVPSLLTSAYWYGGAKQDEAAQKA